MSSIELGLDTFGDVTADADGRLKSHAQVLRDVVAEAELADRVGVDAFGVGEHHRPDFAISAPEVVLAAIAGRTERIRLGTAGGRPAAVLVALERGRNAERLGDPVYRTPALWFVTDVWQGANPELQPHVVQARAGLERLGQ